MASAQFDREAEWRERHRGTQEDSELPPLSASDSREEWARRVRGLRWLWRKPENQRRVVRLSRLRAECLDWIAAQDLEVDECENLVDRVIDFRRLPRRIRADVTRHFAHPRLGRFCLAAAALDVGQDWRDERFEQMVSVFRDFEEAAPLDLERAFSILEVNDALSRLGRRRHRRCMRVLRPSLARAAEVIANDVAFDTRDGMRQVDFALSFLLDFRHDAIAHRLLAQLEAREDLAGARSESARILRWSLALARCRPAGRARDREEFQRQLAHAIEQLSPAFSPVQRARLGRLRLRFLEQYLRADADTFGLSDLWSEYVALIPARPHRSLGIDFHRRRRWRSRRIRNVDSSDSDTSSTP